MSAPPQQPCLARLSQAGILGRRRSEVLPYERHGEPGLWPHVVGHLLRQWRQQKMCALPPVDVAEQAGEGAVAPEVHTVGNMSEVIGQGLYCASGPFEQQVHEKHVM